MKKGITLIVCLVMISILSISFVSADWFTDLFNWGDDSDLEGELASLIPGCTDSDGGKAYLEKGTVTTSSDSQTDYCIDGANLMEYYCNVDGSIGSESHNGHCEDGAKLYESSNGILIEESIGDLVFSDIGYDDDCGFIPGLIDCDLWIGMYDYPLEGIRDINAIVMVHREFINNSIFIDAVGSHFNPNIYNVNEESVLGNNVYIINIIEQSPTETYFLMWYNDDLIINLYIENWDTSKVDDDVLDLLLTSYLEKYSSELIFGGFPEPGCTDMDLGRNYYKKASCTDSSGGDMSDGCIVGGSHDGWLREITCSEAENSVCTMNDYQCPFGCENGVCIQGEGEFCTDTDGGLNFNEAGNCVSSIQGSTASHGDVCGIWIDGVEYPNMLTEWTCTETGSCQRYEPKPYTEGYDCELEGKVCREGACINLKDSCIDSDEGKDYYTKGSTEGIHFENKFFYEDECISEGNYNLMERFCDEESRPHDQFYQCPAGCENGKCKTPKTCVDDDGGENIYEASSAQGSDGRGFVDACSFLDNSKGILKEAVCSGDDAINVEIICPDEAPYCNKAVCSTEKPVCTDTDGGKISTTRGTITEPRTADGPQHTDYCQNTNTKQPWYNYDCEGDDCPACEGELCGIREYFCTDPYITTTYQDISCPDGCVDGECLFTNDLEEGECYDSDNGKNFFEKGTTYDHGEFNPSFDSCEENILTEYYCILDDRGVDYRKNIIYDCPYGCEDGKCIGTGEVIGDDEEKPEKLPENDDENQIIYVCGGCFNENNKKCYPIGYRKKTSYCVDDGTFAEYLQKDEECLNNFECKSNLCIDDTCIKPGIFKAFLEWFKLRFREK